MSLLDFRKMVPKQYIRNIKRGHLVLFIYECALRILFLVFYILCIATVAEPKWQQPVWTNHRNKPTYTAHRPHDFLSVVCPSHIFQPHPLSLGWGNDI